MSSDDDTPRGDGSDAVESPSIDSSTSELGATEPSVAEPSVAEPSVAEPTSIEPTSIEPTSIETRSAEPTSIETRSAEPTSPGPTAEPGTLPGEGAGGAGEAPPPPRPPVVDLPVGMGKPPTLLFALVAVFLALGAMVIVFLPKAQKPIEKPLVSTSADLAPVHAGVRVGGEPVRVLSRLAIGDDLETDAEGRARVRLDSGTTVIVDRKTKLRLTESGLDLEAGRVFVVATAATQVGLGAGATDGRAALTATQAALERADGVTKIYAPSGEISVRATKGEQTVHAGETATVTGGAAKVAPERGFDDWTGGMAAPWAAEGPPRRAVGEIWGRTNPADPGSPLTIRSHELSATIAGEVARTEVKTTFFNAGEASVLGDFRMAIPKGAIVSRFATVRGDRTIEGHIALSSRQTYVADDFGQLATRGDILEWAGDGWLRGTLPGIEAGATVSVVVTYVEWLSPTPKGPKSQIVQYRYPMVGEADPPTIGEFFARVDAGPSDATALAAGLGARISGTAVEVRRPDFKPTADLVVDVEMPSSPSLARGYVAPSLGGEGDPTFIVRTEAPMGAATDGKPAPGSDGVTLALVLDTSTSIDPALLDAGKAFVEAVTRGLGPRDRLVVLAADQGVRPIGPDTVGPVDDARKQAIVAGLGSVVQGGATDLGRSLELAADKLPEDAPDGMVIYIGDGWPTLGDLTPDAIRARLSRRERGAPRLGAVAIGPSANRLTLAALTRDSGPLIEVGDTTDAAKASVELLESALVPTVTDVSVDLGPGVERVYPRTAVAARRGSTVTFVGTLRGAAPKSIQLRYRGPKGIVSEERALDVKPAWQPDDVARRWAALRVESIALSGQGREATTDAALRARLITPWTAWVTGGPEYAATPLGARILDTAVGPDLGFNAAFATPARGFGALASEADVLAVEDRVSLLEPSLVAAAARVLSEAEASYRACRDSRAALRPDLFGAILIKLKLDGDGNATDIDVRGVSDNDDALNRCISTVVSGLVFPKAATTVKVDVSYQFEFPPPSKTLRAGKCSPTSLLPLPLRRGVFRERIDRLGPAEAYFEAKRSCELPNWTAKRSMLELILSTFAPRQNAGTQTLTVATALGVAGDAEAAAFLRKEALRRADPYELSTLRRLLLAGEALPFGELTKQYKAAKDDAARLAVVRRFLAFAPHSARLRGRELALLAALQDKDALVEAVRLVRLDPFADATLLADGAAYLRKVGLEDEARRTFFEIAERGPSDPWARAFLGDRLRNEAWFDDATEDYEVLDGLVPDDAATGIRLALAHAGAGRLDVALRILSRVEKTGGRRADAGVARLAGRLSHLLVAETLAREDVSAADRERLGRRASELTALPGSPVVLVRAPGGVEPVRVRLERGPDKARETLETDAALPSVGLYSLPLTAGDNTKATLFLGRPEGLAPTRALEVELDVLSDGKRSTEKVELPSDGHDLELTWNGAGFDAKP